MFPGENWRPQLVRDRLVGHQIQAGQRVRVGLHRRLPEDVAAALSGQTSGRDSASVSTSGLQIIYPRKPSNHFSPIIFYLLLLRCKTNK